MSNRKQRTLQQLTQQEKSIARLLSNRFLTTSSMNGKPNSSSKKDNVGGKRKINSTGFKGVGRKTDSRKKPFYARISVGDGKVKYVGSFATAQQASQAYQKAMKEWKKKSVQNALSMK